VCVVRSEYQQRKYHTGVKDPVLAHARTISAAWCAHAAGGPNVYDGVRIDYRGPDVTAENFLSVLLGDASAMAGKGTGRVVDSGPHDKVHGWPP
jgi:hypothetical protein